MKILSCTNTAASKLSRVDIDPAQDCCEVVNAVAYRIQAEFLRRVGLGHLLGPQVND
jgi:hypothetical protein